MTPLNLLRRESPKPDKEKNSELVLLVSQCRKSTWISLEHVVDCSQVCGSRALKL